MSIIGYRHNDDDDWRKTCLDKWLEYGSAPKAAKELGVAHVTIRYNAWHYMLFHPDEARVIISGEADKHVSEMYQQEYRSMNDEEWWTFLTVRAMKFLSVKRFTLWLETFEPYKYPKAREVYKVRYPKLYAEHPA
jgi:hypothetical protein